MLQGMRVLDFTRLLPGPAATLMLADLGAEVIRVEWPRQPDMIRMLPPFVEGESVLHRWLSRGKQSLAVDMTHPDTPAVLREVAMGCDLVIESFKPGVMARYGLDAAHLRADKPDLVYCSLSGYGQDGPLFDRAGHDVNYMALAGTYGYAGQPGRLPDLCNLQVADLTAAHQAVMAVLAAWLRRARTGEGATLDLSLYDAAFMMNGLALAAGLGGAYWPEPGTTLLNGGGIYGIYATADQQAVSVGGLEPQFIQLLEQALALSGWTLQALSPKAELRTAARQRLADALGRLTLSEIMACLGPANACVEPVLSLEAAAMHPQAQARGLVTGQGSLRQPAPFLAKTTGLPPRAPGGKLGAASTSVLEAAGFDPARLDALLASGAVIQG